MGNVCVISSVRIARRQLGLGFNANELVPDPDADNAESEGLEARIDLALEQFAKHLLQAAALGSARH